MAVFGYTMVFSKKEVFFMNLNKSTLSEQIYQILRADILSRRIPLGEKLTLKNLKEQFGVSSTPIREALTRLTEEGLVNHYSNIGVPGSPGDPVFRNSSGSGANLRRTGSRHFCHKCHRIQGYPAAGRHSPVDRSFRPFSSDFL